MKKTSIVSWVSIFLLLSIGLLFAGIAPPEEGGVLPEITLPAPEVPTHQNYLGITKNKKTFRIPEIKAEVVLIEIFSMYCPYCQQDAPVVNELYNKIAQDEKLKNKIKLIGIGAGNSPFEVDFFQKTYGVNFPLFPDAEFSIHKMLGEVRTPYFIGVKIKKDGTYSIFYSKRGAIENASKFLNLILSKAGY
ncbi:MAG: TlpA disulfide reductase family protein [Desulfobacterales bacterium]|jgi:thiol-disulfide isomerase/thioredoxin